MSNDTQQQPEVQGSAEAQGLAEAQRQHWKNTYTAHPGTYGEEPSAPAVHAASVFRAAGAREVLDLGAGHGRDALHFAREGFTVRAADFSATSLRQLHEAARAQDVDERVTTVQHDVRDPLPLPDDSVGAVSRPCMLCMTLSTKEIHALFVVAALFETGGAWLAWQGIREPRVGFGPALEPVRRGGDLAARRQLRAHPGRLRRNLRRRIDPWGMVADGYRPDRFDILGALVCLAGMSVIMHVPRGQSGTPQSLPRAPHPTGDRPALHRLSSLGGNVAEFLPVRTPR